LDEEITMVLDPALNNFGVRELLDCFVEIAPSRPKESETN
jgi:peptide subunit release factor RF-3